MRINKFCLLLAAASLIAGSTGINTYADTIYSPNISFTGGPGLNMHTSSPDWRDYQGTGGIAKGTLPINSSVPEGLINMTALEAVSVIRADEGTYTYDKMVEDLTILKGTYGDALSINVIGESADKRPIYDAIVGNVDAENKILITAAIHGREYITTGLVLKQMEYLLYFRDKGAFDGKPLSEWLNSTCIHFVPMVNPDGVSISELGRAGVRDEALWNTICEAYNNDLANNFTKDDAATYLKRWKANARGVNLNDNFDSLPSNVKRLTDKPSGSYYYGTPASEPETVALSSLIDSTHFKANINYHATGGVIYWNFEGNPLMEHARDLANNVRALTGYNMIDPGADGGSVITYMGTKVYPVTSITVEVGSSAAPVSFTEFPSIWAKNKFVPLYTMKWAVEKGK